MLLGVVNASNGNGFGSIHEMVVFQQNGQTFLVENYNGFSNKILKFINVTNPSSAVFVRDLDPLEPLWVHAMMVKGNRMITSGWGSGSSNLGRTEIYDISNIATQAPVRLGAISDPTGSGNSMHSAWPSEDGNYLYSARETSSGSGDVRVYDITDPAAPLLINRLTMQGLGLNAVTPHNPVVAGNYLYVAWYQAGIQYSTYQIRASRPRRPIRHLSAGIRSARAGTTVSERGRTVGSRMRVRISFELAALYLRRQRAVFPFLGPDKILAGDLANGLFVLDVTSITAPLENRVSDFDGDGKTDVSMFSPDGVIGDRAKPTSAVETQLWASGRRS